MCLLRSEESLACAANTTFCPQKTTDILNNPQRHKGHTKKGTMQTLISFKKKRIQNLPPVIDRSRKKVAPLSSLRIASVSVGGFGAKNEERESKTARKMERVQSGPLGSGEGVRAHPLLPLLPTGLWLTAMKDENVGFWTSDYLMNNPKNCSTKW